MSENKNNNPERPLGFFSKMIQRITGFFASLFSKPAQEPEKSYDYLKDLGPSAEHMDYTDTNIPPAPETPLPDGMGHSPITEEKKSNSNYPPINPTASTPNKTAHEHPLPPDDRKGIPPLPTTPRPVGVPGIFHTDNPPPPLPKNPAPPPKMSIAEQNKMLVARGEKPLPPPRRQNTNNDSNIGR